MKYILQINRVFYIQFYRNNTFVNNGTSRAKYDNCCSLVLLVN